MRRYTWASIGFIAACGGSNGGEDCPVGEPGCPCATGTCPATLVCRDDVCVFSGTGDDSGGDPSGTADGAIGDESSSDGASDPGGPEIFEIFADPPTLREDDALTLTAHVTDPDGLEDIVGGVLVSSSGVLIDSFVQISEGSFEVVVSWTAVDAAEPISFAFEGSASLRAEFVDQAEHVGTRTIEIPLDCGGDDFAVCGDGTCRQLGTNTDCGGCNDVCMWCENGACVTREPSACFVPDETLSCADVCASQGYMGCLAGCLFEPKSVMTTIVFYPTIGDCRAHTNGDVSVDGLAACDVPVGAYDQPVARCCCGPV